MRVMGLGSGQNRTYYTKVLASGTLVEAYRGQTAEGNRGVVATLLGHGDSLGGLFPRTVTVHISEAELHQVATAMGYELKKDPRRY